MEDLTENVIADNMLYQVDSEGHHYQVQKEVRDHSSDGNTLKRRNRFIKSRGKNLHAEKKTRGCKLEVKWKNVTLRWIPLQYLKPSNPVEMDEYAVANDIKDRPAFKLWVKDVIRKRDQIISKVKSKYWRTTHKFGI